VLLVAHKIIDISTYKKYYYVQEATLMRSTVTIDKKILDELVEESGHKNKATAVREAVAVYLRQKKVEKIKSMKGKLKFDKTSEDLRHYER